MHIHVPVRVYTTPANKGSCRLLSMKAKGKNGRHVSMPTTREPVRMYSIPADQISCHPNHKGKRLKWPPCMHANNTLYVYGYVPMYIHKCVHLYVYAYVYLYICRQHLQTKWSSSNENTWNLYTLKPQEMSSYTEITTGKNGGYPRTTK